ncbi:tripeptidyl peptidase A [Roridomyces roridus]|uniref:Tripeptidyl peptidase A n=1 Tax=Roridomyces roridus TaxID=1738132 RepID=A0AAD7FXB2_9AGAR|nr:tripeptidyl peptidase A [Roridomyces roridus]
MAPLSLLWLFASLNVAFASSQVKHSLSGVPDGWIQTLDVLPPTQGINLRFGLAHGFSTIESLLQDISDPSHPNYGNHLSKEEVHILSAPTDDTLHKVQAWLSAHDANSMTWSPAKDSVSAVLSVSSAEEMLSTRFSLFEHTKTGERIVRALSYSLPDFLLDHIDFVHPTTAFLDPRRHGLREIGVRHTAREAGPSPLNQSDFISCVTIMDPPCVRSVYNIGNYTPDASLPNHLGVAGYLNISARQDSLRLYLDDYIPESVGSNYTFDVVNITGPFEPQTGVDEGNLDTQLAIQVAYPIPMTYYTTNSIPPSLGEDGDPPGINEPYLNFIDYIMGLDDPPTVITTSYGDDVRSFVQISWITLLRSAKASQNWEPGKFLFPGDSGLGVGSAPLCIANTGNNASTFLPNFPASCPYVTTVGESFGPQDGSGGFVPQMAESDSGAGFSNYFDRPSYQDAVVSAYLDGPANANETPEQARMYNHRGRAFPDMVLIGSGAFFDSFFNRWDIGGGTSASVPTAAGIIALLNDWRLRHGKPTMGFLNPFLYGVGSAGFTDITEGTVDGCEQPGFNATAGWDPASGLGYPNFQKLQELALL